MTKYLVCGYGASGTGNPCAIFDDQASAETQRDTWIAADKAAAESEYGVENVREDVSGDTLAKYVIIKRARTKQTKHGIVLNFTDERAESMYAVEAFTNP